MNQNEPNIENPVSSEPTGNEFFDGKTFIGLSPFITILLIYLTGWVGGLVGFLFEKTNTAVRKCSAQALIMGIIMVIVPIVFGLLPIPRSIENIISSIINIAWLVVTLFCIVKAKNGEHFKLPIIDDVVTKILEYKV